MKTEIKKLLSVVFLFSLIVCFTSAVPSINAMQIPEGAVIKTKDNPDVYIVKYKNGKQYKRLVLNPQVFESYGHLRWEDILIVSQSEINSFATSNLVRVDGQTDIYQLVPNGDVGSKHLLVSTNGYDLDSVYTINSVDFENYKTGDVKGVENLIDKKDSDYDGLENWEEDQKGTDKNNPDTDGDGIIDGLDSHPAGGGRLMAQHFEWDYLGTSWSWDYSIPSDWYDYYKNKEHGDHSADYVTYDDYYIKQIADMLSEKADEEGYSKSFFAAAFIQSLGYVGDEVIGYNDYPKYPLETLAEQNGDCEDTSYLTAAIITAMDIDCVLVELPNHMAVAIAVSGPPEGYYYRLSNGRNYHYIETTAKGWTVGEIPNEYKNQKAVLVKIPSNATEEVKVSYAPFTSASKRKDTKLIQALKKLITLIDEADDQLKNLDRQMKKKDSEIKKYRDDLASSTGQTNGNPWISEAGRVGKLRMLGEQTERNIAIAISEYNSLVKQYNSYLEIKKELVSVADKVNDYGKYGTPLSYQDKSFLMSLGIDL